MALLKLTTLKDGTLKFMISCFRAKFKSSIRDMIKINLDNWKARNFSTPIEIYAYKWEWPLLKATRRPGKQ
jgi:hypothetical protein